MINSRYAWFEESLKKIALLASVGGVLAWDQETGMPPDAVGIRSQQAGILSGITHEMRTSQALQDCVEELLNDSSLTPYQSVNVKEFHRTLQKSIRLSKEFVEQLSLTVSAAYPAWYQAKTQNQFDIFAPHLEKIIALKKEEAQLIGYAKHPYDALMDEFEPGFTVDDADRLFTDMKTSLLPFTKRIASQTQPNDDFFRQPFDSFSQKKFGRSLLTAMGYKFSSGRMDHSEHPFCIGLHPSDVRVTYRLNPNDLSEFIWGLMHEGGHALYEQGLQTKYWGTPMGSTVSLAIHESQSRFWENNIGRSAPFWKYWFPVLQNTFPDAFKNSDFQHFYVGINRIAPSLIRIQADELTYHFHILIRYQIEKSIFEGNLSVNQIPTVWNNLYKEYLGLDVPNNTSGVLQDVHWSHGGFGYFPTYSLGSFYAAQFFHALSAQSPIQEWLEQGQLQPITTWLNENIHSKGMELSANELCKKITGESLNFAYFMQYAQQKFNPIFNLS
ncbi:MAG: carboxypeptidase M32 [Candidatus Competibacteraceae bacterium]|nr:carboxypeptidase M32 [Candidatus Competibacteraceae bacterium]